MKYLALLLCLILSPLGALAQDAPRVAVSIAPLKSLADYILGETGEAALLLPPNVSPHSYALRPSDAGKLSDADLVFWIGPTLELFLRKPLQSLASGARHIAFVEHEDIELLGVRGAHIHHHGHSGHQDTHDDDAHGDHDDDSDHETRDASLSKDPHMWMHLGNAEVMAEAMAGELSALDPANAETYARNLQGLKDKLKALDADLREILAPVRDKPFVTFHDAYQYLEHVYGLRLAGVVTINPEIPPGARQVSELRRIITRQGVQCIFVEPQFRGKVAEQLAESVGIKLAVIDPIGSEETADFFQLMRTNAHILRSCLSEG